MRRLILKGSSEAAAAAATSGGDCDVDSSDWYAEGRLVDERRCDGCCGRGE